MLSNPNAQFDLARRLQGGEAVPLGEVFLRERAFPADFDRTVDRLIDELHDHLATTHDLPFDEAVAGRT